MGDNIILIGMRWTWKTYNWKIISNDLWMKFIDTDELIERAIWTKIKEFVEEHWWDEFRKLEYNLLCKLKSKSNCVISTWGWMPLFFDSWDILKSMWQIIWLKASSKYICRRIGESQSRPSLTWKNPRDEIEELITERNPVYASLADIVIDLDSLKW